MLLFPKPVKKPEHPKRRIAAKSVFKEHRANPLKTYRRCYTDAQVMAKGREYRRERLMNRTATEVAFAELLDVLGVLYESEAIFLNGDRPQLADFYIKSAKLVFEIDGGYHLDPKQKQHDVGRDAWLLRRYGVKTIRFSNQKVSRMAGDERLIAELRNALRLDG